MSLFLSIGLITVCWGIGTVLVKKGYQNLTPWQTYALDSFLVAFPLWMIYGALRGGNLFQITPFAVLTVIFATVVYAIYYYALNQGEVSLTAATIATYPIITLILAYILLHERLSTVAYIGIFLTIIGVLTISIPVNFSLKFGKWVLPSIITSIGYGVGAYLGKLVLHTVNNATYLMMLAIGQIIIVSLWKIFVKDSIPKIKTKGFVYSLIGIVLFNIGNIAYYYSLEKGYSSVVVPLSNTYIVITLILSILWLKEKIHLHQIIGILSVVAGVVLVGMNIG